MRASDDPCQWISCCYCCSCSCSIRPCCESKPLAPFSRRGSCGGRPPLMQDSTSLQNLLYASQSYVKVPEPPRQGSILSIGNRAGICMASFSLVMKSTFFAVAGSKKGCSACIPGSRLFTGALTFLSSMDKLSQNQRSTVCQCSVAQDLGHKSPRKLLLLGQNAQGMRTPDLHGLWRAAPARRS